MHLFSEKLRTITVDKCALIKSTGEAERCLLQSHIVQIYIVKCSRI